MALKDDCQRVREKIDLYLENQGSIDEKDKTHIERCKSCKKYYEQTERLINNLKRISPYSMPKFLISSIREKLLERGLLVSTERVPIYRQLLSAKGLGVGISFIFIILLFFIVRIESTYSSIIKSFLSITRLISAVDIVYDKLEPLFASLDNIAIDYFMGTYISSVSMIIFTIVLFFSILIYHKRFQAIIFRNN
jgi:hypothetical protein